MQTNALMNMYNVKDSIKIIHDYISVIIFGIHLSFIYTHSINICICFIHFSIHSIIIPFL